MLLVVMSMDVLWALLSEYDYRMAFVVNQIPYTSQKPILVNFMLRTIISLKQLNLVIFMMLATLECSMLW